MEKGKFSQPRPYRDEERQIEEAFRQVTGQDNKKKKTAIPEVYPETPKTAPEETVLFQVPVSPLTADTVKIPDLSTQTQETPAPIAVEAPISPAPVRSAPSNPQSASPQPTRKPAQAPKAPFPDIPDPFPDLPEEPEEASMEPESPLEALLTFFTENRKVILVGLCSAALILLIAVIAIFAAGGSQEKDNGRILSNVYIADIPVGGMTKEEAISAVKQATSHTYSVLDMVVDLNGTQLTFSPEDTGIKLDAKAAVNAAYDYGRTGTKAEQEQAQANALTGNHTIGLLPYLNLNTKFIWETLEACADGSGSALTQPSYGLEGPYPSLKADETFDKNAAQTLVLTMGTPGIRFDADNVYDRILDAYSLHLFLVTVDDVGPATEPDEVDLQAIYEEFYVEPVNSRMDLQTFEPIPGSYGYGFDLLSAQLLIDAAEYGEVVRIPMIFLAPEELEADQLFQDVLGESSTQMPRDKNQVKNIQLACDALDGIVLQPGDTFSFNAAVGQRSSANGYKTAPECVGSEKEDMIGGGVCQSAGTLYYSALLADLEIVSRSSHAHPVSYLDYGMDASVTNGADLKFRNNTNYPIQINAEVSGNYVSIQLLGTDQRDYYVKMEYSITATYKPETEYEDFPHDNAEGYLDGDMIRKGITGYDVKTYKLKYSRETGDLLTKDYEASTRYASTNHLVARVEEPETTVPPTTEPPETLPPETTAPPATEPPVTKPSATEPPETQTPETQPPVTEPAETEPTVTEAADAPPAEAAPEIAPPAEEAANVSEEEEPVIQETA